MSLLAGGLSLWIRYGLAPAESQHIYEPVEDLSESSTREVATVVRDRARSS